MAEGLEALMVTRIVMAMGGTRPGTTVKCSYLLAMV
jgi:hypothetical protein